MSKVMLLEMVELRYKHWEAACPEPCPNYYTDRLFALAYWLRAARTGTRRARGTCLGLVYLGVLWHRQLVGRRGWASALQKVLRNPSASGLFPVRITLHSIFCQGVPKSTLKNNLSPGAEWPSMSRAGSGWGPGQFEPEKVCRLQPRAVAGTFWMGIWLWVNPNVLLT